MTMHTETSGADKHGSQTNPATTPTAAPETPPASMAAKAAAWVVRTVPTVIVIVALAGIAYWGHEHDWKLPKFSELVGREGRESIEWCEEHGVPEKDCIACNADLMPKGKLYGWCSVHGVHECVFEHPELAQLPKVPTIDPADLERAARALALRPRKQNNQSCKLHLRRIQFASRAAAEKAGIDIRLVDRGHVIESVSATGEIIYDPTRVARLASRASGTVWRVERNVGDHVKEGDVLAIVDAADVGAAKAALLQAATRLHLHRQTYQRLLKLGSVVAGKRILEAETAMAEAEVALHKAIQTLVNLGLPITREEIEGTPTDQLSNLVQFLGLPESLTAGLDRSSTTANLLPVRAPRDGIVVARDVVAGEVIDTTRTIFTVADTSRMWLVLSVPLEEARYVKIGQRVLFQPDGAAYRAEGQVTWISTDVDTETRVVKVRAELANEDGRLRNETFGAGEIVLRDEPEAIVVPSSAVHWEGCCFVAFVRDKNYLKKGSYKVFHTRMVRPGVTRGDTTEIIAGLLPGEVIVTKGSGILRAELLKGNLGAG